jgi:hypothetical protein
MPSLFVRRFIASRLAGFEKDMKICLTPMPSRRNARSTHAYFPALGACCGLMEYLTGLYGGNLNGIGWRQVTEWARRYLNQAHYGDDVVRVFFEAFRHSVAHRGIASGIWIDRAPGPGRGRRVTWEVTAGRTRPAVQILKDPGVLKRDPPWECPYTHRAHIHLASLKVDIRNAARRYAGEAGNDPDLLANFTSCMRQLYPER